MNFLHILIPFITFLLGCLFALLIKKRENRREIIHRNVTEICNLVNDWLNQLNKLAVELKFGRNISKLEKDVYSYTHNRLVLPKLVRALEVVKEYKNCEIIVQEVENFLRSITNFSSKREEEPLMCATFLALHGLKQVNRRSGRNDNEFVNKKEEERKFEFLLIKLDTVTQKINKESAQLLK